MTWRPYHRDRTAEDRDGYVVIKPVGAAAPIPLFCGLCRVLYRTREDEEAHKEFGCCHLCALAWAHSRKDEWANGWRPSSEDVDGSVARRPPLNVVRIV